jgi:hypothetical protein
MSAAVLVLDLSPWRERVAWMCAHLRQLMATITDPYRPELHYMRGPGPKWRAKHGIRRAA